MLGYYGRGVYLTNLAPNKLSKKELARCIFGNALTSTLEKVEYHFELEIPKDLMIEKRANVLMYTKGNLHLSDYLIDRPKNDKIWRLIGRGMDMFMGGIIFVAYQKAHVSCELP